MPESCLWRRSPHRGMRRRRQDSVPVNAVPNEANMDILVNGTSVAEQCRHGTQCVSKSAVGVAADCDRALRVDYGTSDTVRSPFPRERTPPSSLPTLPPDISTLVLADDNSAPASGDFKLRVVNDAPGLGGSDVYIVATGNDLNTVVLT